jgi:hypothetical protein
VKIRDREAETLKLMGATQMSNKESEIQNSSNTNPNARATKNSFGMTMDPKLETKLSKMSLPDKEREKSPFEIELEQLGRYWIWDNYCDDEYKGKTIE